MAKSYTESMERRRQASPSQLLELAAQAGALSARKPEVPLQSAWIGVEPMFRDLPGCGPARLAAAQQAFSAAHQAHSASLHG